VVKAAESLGDVRTTKELWGYKERCRASRKGSPVRPEGEEKTSRILKLLAQKIITIQNRQIDGKGEAEKTDSKKDGLTSQSPHPPRRKGTRQRRAILETTGKGAGD